MVAVVTDLNRQKINEYIWTVYVENQKAPFKIDEQDALHFFERFYAKHPINEDDECFYYGVLLYEQAFVDKTGKVTQTMILEGFPASGLDEAAAAAVKLTLFKPALQRDLPIGVWITFPIRFQLTG